MNIITLKNSFFSYLEEQGKLEEVNKNGEIEGEGEENNFGIDYSKISLYQYADEFKMFLQSQYDTAGTNLMGKSISDILKMEIEYGKLVDKSQEEKEAEEEDVEEEKAANENSVISSVEDKIQDEISSDMSGAAADSIVENFEDEITDAVEEQISKGYVSSFDIFKDVFNELTDSSEFADAIDVDKSKDIDKKELGNFLNSIKGMDDNAEDVSVYDLLTAASEIKEGRFTFISTTGNSTDSETVKDTGSIGSIDHMNIDSIGGSSSGIAGGGEDFNLDISISGGSLDTGSELDFGNGGSASLDSMTGELADLQEEKAETESDLSTQTDNYNETTNEKEQAVGELDSEIESGSDDLSAAQDEVDTASGERDAAESDYQTAQQATQASQAQADQAGQTLAAAQDNTDEAQGESDAAADNNEQAIQAEGEAQDDSDAANADLAVAVDNTGAAQSNADTKGTELETATVAANEAFSVLNVKNQEVAEAQSAYDNAVAEQNSASESLLSKIASWVSSLWNALSDAINQRDHAQAEADRKAAEQEKAQVASDEALDALEERKEEQAEAQDVADAAQVVLERMTGERIVSDQEYAEALIVLASAMEAEENAESEYNTAFDNYIQCNNYQIDAEGRLQDANGNYISAAQVAQELETYVQGLVESRTTTEQEYDAVIVGIAEVISGDETRIQELDAQIADLQAQIEQEQENIALQEQMLTELSTQQSEINAAEASGGIVDGIASLFGFGNAADQRNLNDKKEILEEALLTGDSDKIAEAYRAIYGDNQVVVNAAGKVVDPSELTEEELAKCTVASVKDLSDTNISSVMHNDAAAIKNATQTIEVINNGYIVCDGEDVSLDDVTAILQEQVDVMAEDMDNAVSQQGMISKFSGAVNNLVGAGTSENEARAQVELYQKLASQLSACTDPVEYAALFKQITGRDFSAEAVAELLAYDKVANGKSTETVSETESTDETKIDITSYVNTITDVVNEDDSLDKDSLAMTKDNFAREAIEDYKETQTAAKDAVIGVLSGAASTIVVTACSAAGICAAPFTGGASLALVAAGFGIAGATGAAVTAGLNAADSLYDADGDGSIDFNYSWKEFAKDALVGGLNGIVGELSNGAGAAIAGKISTQATQTAVTTTLRETLKKGAVNLGGKVVGAAVEGFIDGGMSAGGEYAINALLDENVDFSFGQFVETTLQGGAVGSVFNVGLTTATTAFSAIGTGIKAGQFEADVNSFLSGGTTDNPLAEMVAGKLDDSLLDADGMVNKYAAGQLMKNAETAVTSLEGYFKKIGLDPDNAVKALENVSLADMPNVPTMLSALTQLDLPGIDMTTPEGITDSLGKISGIETNPNGTLASMILTNDGQEIIFDFDSNGKLSAIGLNADGDGLHIDGDDIDIDGGDIHIDGDDIDIDGDDIHIDGDDIHIDGDDIHVDGDGLHIDGDDIHVDGDGLHVDGDDIHVDGDSLHIDGDSVKSSIDGVNSDVALTPNSVSQNIDESSPLNKYKLSADRDYSVVVRNTTLEQKWEDVMGESFAIDEVSPNINSSEYTPHETFSQYKVDGSQEHYAWKMHVFADGTEDFQQIKDVVLPYLADGDINHKVVTSSEALSSLNSGIQRGKAITIYPRSEAEMAQIIESLDYIIRNNGLEITGSDIIGDNNMGDSGRLFYRYEYYSGDYKDIKLDLSNFDQDRMYRQLYDKNRGGNNYLASDMTIDDDIWLNFLNRQ